METSKGEELPTGTIIRRIIRGKERFYHQWRENGKTLSRYLRADEVLPLREKIERRKALLSRLDGKMASADAAEPSTRYRFSCGVLSGNRLAELAASVRPLEPRSQLDPIMTFLKEGPRSASRPHPGVSQQAIPNEGRLLLVKGLPRTGKTILLRQSIAALTAAERETCAYVSLPGDIAARDLLADLEALGDRGVTRVLIDGAERARSFRKIGSVLADSFAARGMRIVIAAAEPNDIEVPPATEVVSTTFLSLADHRIGRKETRLDDYLRHGGPDATQVDERALRALDALNRRLLLRVLTDATHPRAGGSPRLGSDIQKLVRQLGETPGDEPTPADLKWLRDLGIVATAEDETFCILPGLRHARSQLLVRELLANDAAAHLGAAERKIVEEHILNLVADRTLADLVLYRMMRNRKNESTDVFRVRFPHGGFDAVVADREELTCELYEVRNAAERSDQQLANLTNPDMLDTIEHRYGTIVTRTLVYNGRNSWHTSGVAYRKAIEFL